jgi:hypothetical protein
VEDDVYFKGDPATESTRRHLERVLNSPERSRLPWVAAVLAGGAAFAAWHLVRRAKNRQKADSSPDGSTRPT